ncbi:NlpC/P60 family protein [Paenibacillus sp. yr247]|uniref:C40 family peptidase n=1 Tax=Paenibacillus sp. yr247 TaxID=1761880 RepID=UPI0008923389|nr:C40 family peptidase [Paenibacillus sp. yr247]SDM92577.1 NlpC/P60 family protein [Paenibacillus sp. yr247]
MKKAYKTIATFALSLSVFIGGAMAISPTTTHAASISDNIISTGEHYMHTPYRFGSTSGNTRTFDCSSFTQFAFKKYGINLPRTAHAQSQVGKFVPRNQLKPGDLVFFYSPIHHVGIYIGNGKVLHTYGSPGVTISDMNSGWWSNNYATARRVL